MNLGDWLKNKFKKKNNKVKEESYMHSTFIESSCMRADKFNYFSIILLLEFSDDKYQDVCEFLDVANLEASKLISTSIDVENGTDKYGEPIYISYPNNYLLIKFTTDQIISTILNIDKLSNQVLECIKPDIYARMPKEAFTILDKYDILDMNKFVNDKNEQTTFISFKRNDSDKIYSVYFDVFYLSCYNILDQLPNCFNALDALNFMTIISRVNTTKSSACHYLVLTMNKVKNNFSLILKNLILPEMRKAKILDNLFSKDTSIDHIVELINTPVFNRNLEDDNISNGSISDQHIDDIFKQQYDRFNDVTDKDIIYKDIDEIIEDEDIKTDIELKEEDNKDE